MIWRSGNGDIGKELQRECLGTYGWGVKETAAQAGPQERSSTPFTPVRVRPAASARRAGAVRFQGSSADRVLPSATHSIPRPNY